MSWFKKLKNGLKSSSDKISDGVSGIFTKDTEDTAPEEVTEEVVEEIVEANEPAIEEAPESPRQETVQEAEEVIEEIPETPEPIEEIVEEPVIEEPQEIIEETTPEPEEEAEEPEEIAEIEEKPAPKPQKKRGSGGLVGIFTRKRLNEEILQNLEDLLITSDLGVDAAIEITEKLRRDKFDKDISDEEIKEFLAEEITEILEPVAKPLELTANPHVVLVVGVNGNGKTTSIGKIANNYREEGKSVLIAAADTFRAAAVEQLQEWGNRAKVPVFTGQPNQDPASVAYQALDQAIKDNTNLVLIDTAGRLQNKHNLMQELEKIAKVSQKLIPDAPHEVILVLDATTGQNALSQVEEFTKVSNISGLIVTKLDGTAKGGVVVALAKKFDINIHAIGVGEGIDDLKPFNANEFARNLVGLES